MGGGIPREVERFVRTTLASVQQLDVLLLLRDRGEHVWTADEVGRTLRTNREAAEQCLVGLAAIGLVAAADADGFHYRPGSMAATVDELARVYPAYRARIIGLIYSGGNDHVEAFADAFRLRRRKDD